MARRLIVAPQARNALADARKWLLQPGSGPAGRAKWIALRDAPKLLLLDPCKGARYADLEGMRQYVVAGHRILYELRPDTGDSTTAGDVYVLLVLGPGKP